jgi:hypothetical protein
VLAQFLQYAVVRHFFVRFVPMNYPLAGPMRGRLAQKGAGAADFLL